MVSMDCSAVSGGFSPSLYSQCRFLSVGGSVSCWSDRPPVLHLNTGLLTHFTPPTLLALPAMTQSSEWQLSSFGSLSAGINGYRHCPSALCTCPSRGPQPKHFTWSLYLSSVDAPVDVHNPSHNFPYFHPWEFFLVGHRVTALPFCSCGVIPASPPKEVVLLVVGLVHLSCVWWVPIHKGTPTSDSMRRSWFWWRTRDCLCWFVTS